MSSGAQVLQEENWVVHLLALPNQSARRALLRRNPQLLSTSAVEELYGEVVRLARIDLNQAAAVARALSLVAEYLGDDHSKGISLRATGHVLYLTGKHKQAVEHYEHALHLFRRLRSDMEIGRTCVSGLQSLIYLGEYTKAMSWVRSARSIFRKHGDRLRLARLDNNTGNIAYRQDRFHEALRLYTRAYREFQRRGEPSDVAIALRNIAVCHISLNHFARALKVYDHARRYCSEHNMPLLVAECDYNIAYLYYLRGQYTAAMRLYEVAREHCERVGDRYHMALCDLDGSELYLEVNLLGTAVELAERAFSIFQELRMRYEAAKALTNLAIAATQRGENDRALNLLRQARQLFRRERNLASAALTDFYEAVVFYRSGNFSKARRLCQAALRFFSGGSLPGKAALCKTLLARLDLQAGNLIAARQTCTAALRQLRKAESPALDFRAHLILGEINEALGNPTAAERNYFKAHETLEHLRTQLRAEEPKIKFVQDKLVIYEKLVQLCVARPNRTRREAAFSYIEHAKSRSLADLISFRAYGLPGSSKEATQSIDRVRQLREELNWTYKRMELHDLEGSSQRAGRQRLRAEARDLENQLAKTLSALSTVDEEYLNLQNAKTADLRQIRSAMPADTLLLDYYTANGLMYVAVVGPDGVDVAPLVPVAQIRQHLELLQLQLSKFRLGGDYVSTFSKLLRSATEEHLRALYGDLLAPVRHQLNAKHLVIAPHDLLHYVPFHALKDGDQYVIDNFSVSYTPSASVYYLCSVKQAKHEGKSLVMGIPDVLAPNILDEAKAVAATLPNAELFLGRQATVDRLRRYGPASRFVHIATHGIFRQDNPIFSSIRLGDTHLHLFDLYELRLNAELVTLSGCGTGLNVVVTGDELLGLVRGLLYAGSEAALVTLWDVQDKSTAEFMKLFYKELVTTSDKSLALKTAVQQLRQTYPDVYYWAPFVLIGKFDRQ
jgi:CHAT domain-containing protein/Tfp pilus assembly protein PilF